MLGTFMNAASGYLGSSGMMGQLANQTGVGVLAGLTCIIPAIFFIIAIALAVWVYKDAEKRGKSGALWLIIVLITGIIGLIIWLIVRPDMSEVRRQQQQGWQRQSPQQQPPQQQQQQQPQQQPTQQPTQQPSQQDSETCPDCGQQMRYIDDYDRWYCDSCGEYK